MQFSEIFMAIILKTFREQIYGDSAANRKEWYKMS